MPYAGPWPSPPSKAPAIIVYVCIHIYMCVLVSICICFVCIRGPKAKTTAKAEAKPKAKTKTKAKLKTKPKTVEKKHPPAVTPKKARPVIKRPAAQEEDEGDACCLHTICVCLLVCLHFTFDRAVYSL